MILRTGPWYRFRESTGTFEQKRKDECDLLPVLRLEAEEFLVDSFVQERDKILPKS
jgi:hypothetical protein